MENKDYIVAIDLGDSNIVVAVGSAADGGRINIDHILSRPSEGVSAGQIMNIDLAVKTIKGALAELRDITGLEVLEAYAGISGEFIYCTSHTDHVFVPDHKNGVTQQVVDALFERMGNVLVSEDRYIMERIPQRYVINDTTEVDNPVGVFGSPLSSTFNFISSDNIPLSRIDMALRRLDIIPRRTFSNAVVVGDAVLSPDEKEEGVVVIDIGGELTDISIYHRNVVRYISTIPIGAKSFNNDIRTLTIPERYIEPLKLKYGRALAKNAPQDITVVIKGRSKHDQREIALYNLAAVIEARARDIAELVSKDIAESGFADKVPYGIVLTGGSAQLRCLDELFREVTGLEVRVAEAEDVISPSTRTKITSSADSTVVGLLLHGMKYGPCAVRIGEPKFVPPVEEPVVAPVVVAPVVVPPQVPTPEVPVQPIVPVEPKPKVVVPPPYTPPTPTPVPRPTPTPQPVVPQPVVPQPQAPTPKPGAVEGGVAPVSINNTNGSMQVPEVKKDTEEEPPVVPPVPEKKKEAEPAPAQPKRRVLKLFSSFAQGANKLVKSVNNHFDVDEEEEV
ncbi:MAG: cell division protein FtsA [Rikenellaceae bacterium]